MAQIDAYALQQIAAVEEAIQDGLNSGHGFSPRSVANLEQAKRHIGN